MSKRPKGPETLESLVGESLTGIADEVHKQSAAEQRDAEQRERRAGRERRAVFVLVPLLIVLTALNLAGFSWLAGNSGPTLSADEARAAATQLLSDAVDELEFYFEDNGAYPGVPAFIGPDGADGDDEPFTYELMGSDRYVLSATVQGETVQYDSRADADVAFREVRRAR